MILLPLPSNQGGEAGEMLFELQSALDWESLWQASLRLISAALPHHSCSLLLGIKERTAAHARHSVVAGDHFNYSSADRVSVAGPFLETHPEIKLYTYADVLETDPHAPHRRLEKEVVLSAWSHFVHLVFWNRRQPDALLSIRRTAAQGDFTLHERTFLAGLHAVIDAGLHRLRRLQEERRRHALLEEFVARLPLPVLLLDAAGKLDFATQEGYELCALWNHGAHRARLYNSRSCFQVPAEIAVACRSLLADTPDRSAGPSETRLAHAGIPGLSVHIARRTVKPGPWATTDFIVTFLHDRSDGHDAQATPAEKLIRLRALSPSERQVALLVADGLRNQEIARVLGKSLRTVEFQLNAAYRKLGLGNRTQLVRMLV